MGVTSSLKILGPLTPRELVRRAFPETGSQPEFEELPDQCLNAVLLADGSLRMLIHPVQQIYAFGLLTEGETWEWEGEGTYVVFYLSKTADPEGEVPVILTIVENVLTSGTDDMVYSVGDVLRLRRWSGIVELYDVEKGWRCYPAEWLPPVLRELAWPSPSGPS